eukprot:1178005-Prorocentrum_minimum.AAC.6
MGRSPPTLTVVASPLRYSPKCHNAVTILRTLRSTSGRSDQGGHALDSFLGAALVPAQNSGFAASLRQQSGGFEANAGITTSNSAREICETSIRGQSTLSVTCLQTHAVDDVYNTIRACPQEQEQVGRIVAHSSTPARVV